MPPGTSAYAHAKIAHDGVQSAASPGASASPGSYLHQLSNSSKSVHLEPVPPTPPLEYQLLLLSMAEEYLAAAYGRGSIADIVHREIEMQEYYKLIATGLGCLEAVLKHFKLQPEREAIVRLRYATILYEETDNAMEAEEALSKGISVCDRHRFIDLKYDMQHLLARIMFRKSPRAAHKYIDGVIQDAEAYKHVAWVYAFRFLKLSLYFELSSHQDMLSALTQIQHLMSLSKDSGDKAVLAFATTVHAFTCLKVSSDAESVEQAQRSLASVRSWQYDPVVGDQHELAIFTSFVELCCNLQMFDPDQVISKMQIMQTALKIIDGSTFSTADGTFGVPIPLARMPPCQSNSGIIRKWNADSLLLMFNWMPKEDIYSIGHLLSGVAMAHKNSMDGQKAEHMLDEGIRRIECKHYSTYTWNSIDNSSSGISQETSKIQKSLMLTTAQQAWREQLVACMQLHLAFALCARTSWPAAKAQQREVLKYLSHSSSDRPVALLAAYLEGVIYQGCGFPEKAARRFMNDMVSMDEYRRTPHASHFQLDLALLSTLNAILAIRSPHHPLNHMVPTMLTRIDHLCSRSPDRRLRAAYHFVAATTSSASTILQTKQSLQAALQLAKAAGSNQIMCIDLNFMSWKFFRGVVGDQAQKSAQASQALAQKCMDSLWMSVSAGVYADTLDTATRSDEAARVREMGFVAAQALPDVLQQAMRNEDVLHGNASVNA